MAAAGRPAWPTVAAVATIAVLCVLAVVVANAPANWLASALAERTRGVVLLADARGTVWSGSAVLALGSPLGGPASEASGASTAPVPTALALPGRVTWTLEFERALAPVLHLTHDGVLSQPLAVRYRDGVVALDPGTLELPASLLRLTGAPLNTLLPEGRCTMRWNGLRFEKGQDLPVGEGTLRIAGFALAISPVKPLGDYLVSWSSGATGLAWQLATERGPLDLQGGGSIVAGRSDVRSQVRVAVRVARDAPVAVARQLDPLLDMLGRRSPDEAVIESGRR